MSRKPNRGQSVAVKGGTYLVFEKQSGTHLHTHRVVALFGAKQPAPAAVKKEALRLAAMARNKKSAQLQVIRVGRVKASTRYRIDLKTKRLKSLRSSLTDEE